MSTPLRVLITGGCGFIGSHLVAHLSNLGHRVIICDRQPLPPSLLGAPGIELHRGEIADLLTASRLLQGVDVAYHLAWAHIPESATQHPVGDIQANLIPTIRLLQGCVEHRVRRLVFLSTGGAIYGRVRRLPVTESHPPRPISAYGVTKLAAEKYIDLYHHLHGLSYAILRPSVPYGPGQDPLGRQGAVSVFIGSILTGRPITLWGDGDAIVRDFFHVSDLARAAVLAAGHSKPTGVFNIGGGRPVSLNHLLALLCELAEPEYAVQIQRASPRPFDVPRLVLDISAARANLGWAPELSLRRGLAATWEWYKNVWLPTAKVETAPAAKL
jgi:UDP-glucose 4-epimerase